MVGGTDERAEGRRRGLGVVGASLRSGNPGNEASLRAKEAGTVEIRTIKL